MAGQRLFIAIARITNNFSTKSVIGYRLAQVDSELAKVEIKDVPTDSVKSAIMNKVIKIENIALVSGEVTGIQGSLERLPLIMLNGGLVDSESNRLTIAYEIGDAGYRVVAWNGVDKKLRTEEIIGLVNNNIYAGLSNGKIVDRDGMQFISAINGEFKHIAIKKVKSGKITSEDIFNNKKDQIVLKKTVNMASTQAQEEIDFNDTFRLLTESQRKCIETYYTWWTTTTFNSLTRNTNDRLKANPKKMQTLAELRGKDIEWSYGGCVPAGILAENRQAGRIHDYCQLGHKIYNVHRARGVDKEGNRYLIKFGSQCSQDFFDISPEGLRKLVKVSDAMKEEIEFICNTLRDGKIDEEWTLLPFMTQLVDRLITLNSKDYNKAAEQLKILFGDKYPVFLISFRMNNIPFPKSLLELCREYLATEYKIESKIEDRFSKDIDDGLIRFFDNLNKVAIKNVDAIEALKLYNDADFKYRYAKGIWMTVPRYFYFIVESKLEGKYGYDPVNKIGKRGKGRFTQEASYNFEKKVQNFEIVGLKNHDFYDAINALNALGVYYKLGQYLSNRFEEHTKILKDKYNKSDEFIKKDVYPQILENIERNIRNSSPTTIEESDYNFALQGLAIASTIAIKNITYSSYGNLNMPKARGIYYNRIEGVVPIKCNNIHRLLELVKQYRIKIDEVIEESLSDTLKKCERDYQKELEARRIERELEYRKSIVCSNEECKYNSNGSCYYIIKNGVSADFVLNEHNYITKCNKFEDKDPQKARLAARKVEYAERTSRGELDRIEKLRNIYFDTKFIESDYRICYSKIEENESLFSLVINDSIKSDIDIEDTEVLHKIDNLISDITARLSYSGWKVDEMTGNIKWLSTRRNTGNTEPCEDLPLILNREQEPLDLLGIYRMVLGHKEIQKIFIEELEGIESEELKNIRFNRGIKVIRDVEEHKSDMIEILRKVANCIKESYKYFDVKTNKLLAYLPNNTIYDNLLESWMIPSDKLDIVYTNFKEYVDSKSYGKSFINMQRVLALNDNPNSKREALVECANILKGSYSTIDIYSGAIIARKTPLLDEYDQYRIMYKAVVNTNELGINNLASVKLANVFMGQKDFISDGGILILNYVKLLRVAMLDILLYLKDHDKYYSFEDGKVTELKRYDDDEDLLADDSENQKREVIVVNKELKTDLLTLYNDISKELINLDMKNKITGNSIVIADDISSKEKYKNDNDLSFKQVKVVKNAIEQSLQSMGEAGYNFNTDTRKFEVANNKKVYVTVMSNADIKSTDSEEVNWQKKLEDDPKIKAEVDKLLQAIAQGDSRLSTKIANIAFSVKKYGKVSMKQYKYIKEGIEKLEKDK